MATSVPYEQDIIYEDASYTYDGIVFLPLFFSLIDKRFWVYQTNLVRWRHRFRGVRESLKVNQEIGQYFYDISKADRKIRDLNSDYIGVRGVSLDGGDIVGIGYSWYDDAAPATPVTGSLSIDGFNEIDARIERLRNRIKILEDVT